MHAPALNARRTSFVRHGPAAYRANASVLETCGAPASAASAIPDIVVHREAAGLRGPSPSPPPTSRHREDGGIESSVRPGPNDLPEVPRDERYDPDASQDDPVVEKP